MTWNLVRIACILSWLAAGGSVRATDPTFLARRDYVAAPNGIAVADTNGDGILDVITAGTGSITVLLGNGDGTLQAGVESQTGTGDVYFPTAADLDGNGSIYVIVSGQANYGDTYYGVGVCLGNGNGTFQPAVFYQAGTDEFLGNAVYGDFNGDGVPDIAVSGESGIWLFTGKGDGAFNPGVLTPMSGPAGGQAGAADFNGDGNLDLVVTTQTGFAILLGNGDGTFQPPQAHTTTPLAGVWLTVGDVNLDGHPDIVLCAYSEPTDVPNYVLVYLGNGSGGFSAPSKAQMSPVEKVAIGDVNGDNIPDLIGGFGYVALGNGNGTFRKPVQYFLPSGISLSSAVPADLRNAGLTDLVFQDPDGSVSVLLNRGKGTFEDGEWTAIQGASGCGVSADFNGDGNPDYAVNTTAGISIFLGTGKASQPFQPGATIAVSGTGCLVTGDLNGDGIPDLLVPANGSPNALLAYLGNGDGTFTLKSTTPTPNSGGYVILADFNNDGKLDFATSGNLIALGNGDGTFQTPVPILPAYEVPAGFTNLAAGDLNGDGWTDLVMTDSYESYIYVFLNNQKGGFTASRFQALIRGALVSPGQVVLSDLSGSGNLDIVVASTIPGAFVYKSNGAGGFTLAEDIHADNLDFLPSVLAISDVNGDGIPDLIMSQGGSGSTLGVFLGKGNGAFKEPYYIGAGPYPGAILLDNLHGQAPSCGFPDVAVPDVTGGVMVLFNLSASTCPGS
ncbi:MAG TPA: VCBS repeat-containing protein [Bryobacteraceae bacterium]|nr:VCBS repeat-containing protein [Bryobacteraceae bacterium]